MSKRHIIVFTACALIAACAATAQDSTPTSFKAQKITTPDGVEIFVRSGGSGPAVLLLHGYGETSDMWGPLAQELMKTRRVIMPDLRGLGRSSRPAGGYDKKTQAGDMRAVLTALGQDQAAVVGHDIGNMVAYAYAALYAPKVEKLVVMDAPVPGVGPWEEVLKMKALWHFSFGGPHAEKLVQGRERIYLDRFWDEFAADPSKFSEAARAHYAEQYAQPGAMRAGFAQFAAFSKDAEDNQELQKTKLTMPVLAAGGEKSFNAMMAVVMRSAATDVRQAVIPNSGHWVMEENPDFTVKMIASFLAEPNANGERRTTPAEFDFESAAKGGTGTSGVSGIQTVILHGDPNRAGLYTIMLKVPANTRIEAHEHPDDRVATVVSGTWYFGYGDKHNEESLKALPPGSFYTEPPGRVHFAATKGEPAIVQITGFGPSGTKFVGTPR